MSGKHSVNQPYCICSQPVLALGDRTGWPSGPAEVEGTSAVPASSGARKDDHSGRAPRARVAPQHAFRHAMSIGS